MKYLNTILLVFTYLVAFSQATIYTDDFESGMTGWNTTGDLAPNFWLVDACAGNGSTLSGSSSLYISKGGSIPGCGGTGTEQFAYESAASGSNEIIVYTTVDATCATSIQVNFDYRIDGVSAEDFAQLVYSTDNGVSWIPVGPEFSQSTNWTNNTIALPFLLDGTSFELGFSFTYNDATINGFPPAIDNIKVSGTDTVDPVVVCQTPVDLAVNSGCQPILLDYTKSLIALSDNCTDSAQIIVVQDILPGTILPGAPGTTQDLIITATDEAGNSGQCLMTINIIDDTNPVIACPGDSNIYVDENCEVILPDFNGEIIVSDNCTSAGSITLSQNPLPGMVLSGHLTNQNIQFTATDESGNFSTCSFNVRTIDTLVATIICPTDTTVYKDNSCQGTLADYTSSAIVNDNCVPSSSLIVSQNPAPGTTITANQTITLTLTGGIPATSEQCTFNAQLIDTIAPSIVCGASSDLYADASCEALLTDYTGSALINENCPGYVINQSPSPGTTLNPGTSVITLTITDAAGLTDQCQFNQQVLDTISPVISCPADQSQPLDVNCQLSISDFTGLAIASDNCTSSLVYSQVPSTGTINSPTQITITVTDNALNDASCSFWLIPIDNTNPTINCPGPTQVSVDATCSYSLTDFTGGAIGADNCSPAISLVYSQSPVVGTILNPGIQPIQISVSDTSGNTGVCNFNLTVVDLTPPTVSCPANQNDYVNSSCELVLQDYTGLVTANDNCSAIGALSISQLPPAGATLNANTVITIEVMDEEGNSNNCNFSVILVDTIKPLVTCPGDQTIAINSSCQYTISDLTGLVTGSDNCSALGNMTIVQSPIAGATEDGITNVQITLFDEQGNQATCVTTFYPIDNEAPEITCPAPAPVNNGTSCDFTLLNYASSALVMDNCSNYTIEQNPPMGTIIQTGENTITLTVTDAGGNTDVCNFILEVFETENPVITCPGNISGCDSLVNYSDPVFSDNCFAFLTQTDMTGLTSGDIFPVGVTTLEYTVADSSGNNQSCSFTVEVFESPSPAIIMDDTLKFCGTTAGVIEAEGISSGSGLWTQLSGSGAINNQFANATGVNNLSDGEHLFVWTVSTTNCGFDSDSLMVIVSQLPLEAQTQDIVYSCNDESVNLMANPAIFDATGMWSTNLNATIIDPTSQLTSATLVDNGWNDFIWSISSPGCPTTRDTLHVFVTRNPQIVPGDTTICIEDNPVLTFSADPAQDNQIALWTFATGFAEVENPYASTTSMQNFNLGNNYIVYHLDHHTCPDISDTVIVVATLCTGFNPDIPTVITPNSDGRNDLFEVDYLAMMYPECHVIIFNRWGSVVYESTGYAVAWDGTHNGEELPMGTYFYKIELNDESGTVYQGDINIIH